MPPRRVVFAADGSVDKEGSKAANAAATDSDEEEELKRARIAEIMGSAPVVKSNQSTSSSSTTQSDAPVSRCPCCQRPFDSTELKADREIKLGRDKWCIHSAMRAPTRPVMTGSKREPTNEDQNEESVFVPGQIAAQCEKRLRHFLSQSIDDKHKVWPDIKDSQTNTTSSSSGIAMFLSSASR